MGIPVSNAVNMFLKQVVMQRGIPFDVKLPATKPVGTAGLTEKELNAELEKAMRILLKGMQSRQRKLFRIFARIMRYEI